MTIQSVLLQIIISGHFRKTDVIGRIGGDEFIVFITDIPNKELARQKVNDLVGLLRYKPNITLPTNASISVGLATTKEHSYEFEELFNRADQALYCAKRRISKFFASMNNDEKG